MESPCSVVQSDDCEKRRHLGSAHRRPASVCHATALGQALQSEGARWGWLLFTVIIGAFLQPASSRESERIMPARPPSSLFLAKSAHLYVQDALRVQQTQFYLGCAHAFGGSQSGGDCVRAHSVHAKDWESSELVDVGARGGRRLLQDADQKSANNNTNLIIILSVCIPVGVIFLMVGVWCVVYRRLPGSPDHQNSSSKVRKFFRTHTQTHTQNLVSRKQNRGRADNRIAFDSAAAKHRGRGQSTTRRHDAEK
jgi:hypothetical protein